MRVVSRVPSIAGQTVELYVRERFRQESCRPTSPIASFCSSTDPAEVAFDVPRADDSWMAYLASAGFVVYAMDTSGYGRSVRREPMKIPAICRRNSRSSSFRH